MKTRFLLLTLFCLPIFLNAQWDSLGDDIIPLGHRAWSLKMAPDESIWAISTFDSFPPTGKIPIVHRSADAGVTWIKTEIPEGIDDFGWDISPVNQDIAYIALNYAGLYRTLDGGLTWNKVQNFPNDLAILVHFFNENDGWVFARNINDAYLTMSVTSDGGGTWTNIGGPDWLQPLGTSLPDLELTESLPGYTFSASSVYDYTDESIMVGTTKGTYWLSTDKGYNWKRYESPLVDLDRWASNVTMKDSTTLMLASDYEIAGGVSTKSFATTDGGNTWIEGEPEITAGATHYLPGSDGIFIMVGHNNFGGGGFGTTISYNYGEDWEKIHLTRLLAVDFLDENTGVATCCNLSNWSSAGGQIFKWNYDLPTGIKNILSSSNLKILPNPVNDILTIELDEELGGDNLFFEIIALDGKVVKKWDSNIFEKTEINVQDLISGFYILKIESNEKVVSEKFIKE